ncbi:hypothetical protein LCGC14_3149030, partial [marine sediment metagenome]
MSRYTKQHYEDVARLLKDYALPVSLINRFADLFAADNPPSSRCWNCGDSKEAAGAICTRPNEGHRFGGFDRKQFLAACGLEPDTIPIDEASEAVEPPHRYG